MSLYATNRSGGSGGGVTVYVNFAAFPASAANGTLAVDGSTHIVYEYNSTSVAWEPVASNTAYLDALASAGAATSIGNLDSQAANAKGLALAAGVLSTQSADATHPGMVNNTTQSFSGAKTFTGTIAASNLSGTNTGDVTLTAVGATPNANGASLAGQVLTLQPASTSFPGVLTAADWNTFNSKLSTTLTSAHIWVGNGSNVATDVAVSGDLVLSNTGATTLLKIQGQIISGVTGNGNVVLSGSPILITPNLGTPSTLVGTNITGTAAGLTAGNVTTNANLTGPITSVGNATSVASQTGTGSTFVMNTSPTLVTPVLGAASATSLTLSTPLAPNYGGAGGVSKDLYVDKTRTDSFTPDGSFSKPFATIAAAVAQVVTNADNSASVSYTIHISSGLYLETITLNNAALKNLSFVGQGYLQTSVGIQAVGAITSTSNNDNLGNLCFSNIFFAGNVNFTGGSANSNTFNGSAGCYFKDCEIQVNGTGGTVTINNVNYVVFEQVQFNFRTDFNVTNTTYCRFFGGEISTTGTTCTLVTTASSNYPNGFDTSTPYNGTFVIFAALLAKLTTTTLDVGSDLQLRHGCRYGETGGTISATGLFESYSSYIRSNITVNSGGELDLKGSFYQGTLTNSGTVTYSNGATQINYTPATSGNWNTVPTLANGAFDSLAVSGIAKTQTANKVLAGPTSGGAALPTFRTLVTADMPSGTGTVTSASVVSANGFAGTVATATTTPAITLTTTITGVLSGNGTAISAAATTGSGSVVLATSPTLVTPALGTPTALVGTNITGTATSFTASNVTTNANLTGDVTSVGNATTYAGTVPLNKGGTGQTTKVPAFDALSPMTTGGDLIYGGASGTGTRLANGSNGQVLTSAGGTSAPTWTTPAGAASYFSPTVQRFTSSSGTYNQSHIFTVTSASATVGATYTNNSITFTVSATIASATTLTTTGAGTPLTSGTLTKTGGTGDSTITFSAAANPLYICVEAVGQGGGGAGSGAASGGVNGTAGSDTTFGSSLITAGGGAFGSNSGSGAAGAGGTATINSPALAVESETGAAGGNGIVSTLGWGGNGGGPGGGAGGYFNAGNGVAGAANTGGGGGGGGSNTSVLGGGGGGGGARTRSIIRAPSTSYAYVVGDSAGAGGGAGTSGAAGATGGTGRVIVTEYFQ